MSKEKQIAVIFNELLNEYCNLNYYTPSKNISNEANVEWVFFKDSMFARPNVRKYSLTNRQKDYMCLANQNELLSLHYDLNKNIYDAANTWDSYDYGEGYFYQSCDAVHVTGLRDTTGRIQFMNLKERLKGKKVLEIGCNTSFLTVSVARFVKTIEGFDINPFLISSGKRVAKYLKTDNCTLKVCSFEKFSTEEKFDTVLSFANHSTFDKNTKQSVQDYFKRCHDLLKPSGELLFESHPPEHEGEGLKYVIAFIIH